MKGKSLFQDRLHRIIYLGVSTPLALFLGILLGKFLLPWVQAAAVFPLYWYTLAKGNWRQTAFLMLGWAALLALLVGLLSFISTGFMETRILHGAAYKKEMFHWVSTGIGPEGDVTQFLPQHALHFLIFTILTLVSGGFLGLVMGSSLMNYMSFYVGALLVEADSFIGVLLLAWPPWAIVRVIGFILVAMALSAVVLSRFFPQRSNSRQIRFYSILGVSLLLLDVVLKWRLAGIWQELLKRLTDL